MHARLILLGVIAVAGCTLENPAFDETGGTQGETSANTSVDTEAGSGEEGQPLVCGLDFGQPIQIKLPPTCNEDDDQGYDRWFTVLGAAGSTWQLGACTNPNCDGCELFELPLTFAGIEVGQLASTGACLRVSARRRAPLNPDSCEFDTVVVSEYANNVGAPVLIARNHDSVGLPVVDPAAGPMLDGFDPQLVLADQCACSEYPADCCDGVGPAPAVYEYDLGLADTIAIDERDTLTIDGVDYEFWALDASETGACDDPMRVAWTLTRE
ncbi:hypothetical protein [Enhygromyxa salina]|uniref:Lipoprotein n=1 Tax=Enhygromyxa salina TaxID=215803 RepID=A0A2S9Y655_9BACT|nr:hypothetical protein [Enhygromyxa salina]PRQ00578.1 hypothetical protein ENSA7_60720 [Enhygromyxa salina]